MRLTIHDGHIVGMAWMHFQEFRIFIAGRPCSDFLLIADRYRIAGLKSCNSPVLHVYTWHPVACCRDYKTVVKSDIKWTRCDFAIPVWSSFRTKTKMPFANSSCNVTCILEHSGYGCFTRKDDSRSISGQYAGTLPTPGIFTCQQGIP